LDHKIEVENGGAAHSVHQLTVRDPTAAILDHAAIFSSPFFLVPPLGRYFHCPRMDDLLLSWTGLFRLWQMQGKTQNQPLPEMPDMN
jgi:hypothetical protein